MLISENKLKWLMRLYPPMLFQRIWVTRVHSGFNGIDVKINRSWLTTNLGRSIFGGTIFTATDPFYALLFSQLLQRRGFRVMVWLKSAQINYLKPARTDLRFSISIPGDAVDEAILALQQQGKFVRSFPIELYDVSNTLCVTALNEVYIRDLDFIKADVSAVPVQGESP